MLASGSAVPLDDIEIHRDVALTNYLFAPHEERAFVQSAFAGGASLRS